MTKFRLFQCALLISACDNFDEAVQSSPEDPSILEAELPISITQDIVTESSLAAQKESLIEEGWIYWGPAILKVPTDADLEYAQANLAALADLPPEEQLAWALLEDGSLYTRKGLAPTATPPMELPYLGGSPGIDAPEQTFGSMKSLRKRP